MELEIAGERVTLLPERAAWWSSRRTLVLADPHWGKAATFRARGLPVPDGDLERDLASLLAVIERVDPARIIVVGDLIHAADGVTLDVVHAVAALLRRVGREWILVRGNHDRSLSTLPEGWSLRDEGARFVDSPFAFSHLPIEAEGPSGADFVWSGHVHPVVELRGGGEALTLPCFVIGRKRAIVPAFGSFTGGSRRQPWRKGTDRCFVVAEDRVIEVG